MQDKDKNLDFFKIKTNDLKPKKGRLLLADPFASDFFFTRSVVLITEYSPKEGTMGFILNKPIEIEKLPPELFEEFGEENLPRVYYGGPVGTNQMFYVHRVPPTVLKDTFEILPGLYWGGKYDELVNLMHDGVVSKNDVKFFIGYAGWAPGQLEGELQHNFWVIAETDSNEVLGNTKNLWKRKLKQLGPKYAIWTTYSLNPELN